MMKKRREATDGLTGWRRTNAARWAAMHPAINDWIAAAPALALLPPVAPIDAVFRRCAAGGFRLKAAMAALGVPYVFRRLGPSEVMNTLFEVFHATLPLDPRVIAVAMQDWRQSQSAIRAVMGRLDGTSCEALTWAIRHRDEIDLGTDMGQIIDYFQHHGQRFDWSPKRIREEHDRWAGSMRTERALKEANRPMHQVRVDIGKDPQEIEIDGVICTALTSGGALIVEGARMQHCVGGSGFAAKMHAGERRYYHLESHHGQSTVEFVKGAYDRTEINQHKALHNAQPVQSHMRAAEQLALRVTVPVRNEVQHSDLLRRLDHEYRERLFQMGHSALRAYSDDAQVVGNSAQQLRAARHGNPFYETYRRTIAWDLATPPQVTRDDEDPTT